jgi:hypothetical protein
LRAAVVIAAAVIAAIGLLWTVIRHRKTAVTIAGPLACLGSVAMLAISIGYERDSALEQRYVVLGATLLFVAYVCLALLRNRAATLASWGLLLTSLMLLPWNAYNAISFGEARRAFESDLVRDIRAGVPVDLLGTRYYEDLWGDPALAARALKEMRDDRIGPFANGDLRLNDAAPTVASEETISTTPVAVHNMTKTGDYWQTSGGDAFMLLSVGSRELAGIRLKYSLASATSSPAYLQLAWSDPSGTGFDKKGNRFVVWGAPVLGEPEQTVAWIGERVGMLRITPDIRPVSFKLDEVVLLLSS